MNSRRKLLISIVALGAVYWVGVAGYVVIDPAHVKVTDAMYMVAITVSTVGFTEAIPLGPAGHVWTVIVILLGFTSVMCTLSLLTTMMVEGEIGRLFGSRKLESRIRTLNHHVIVCGFGRMGRMLVQHLVDRAVSVVVIENDPAHTRLAEEMKQLYVMADATEEESLRKAGIARARSLVAVLPCDADNVFVTLTAREMRSDLYIVARAEQHTATPKLRRAGANRVILPQAIGAERMANVLTRPHVVDLMEMASKGVVLEIDQFIVPADSPIAGKTLREANIRQTANVMVVVIKGADGKTRFNPGADEIIHPRDTLILIGQAGAASRLAEMRIVEQAPVD